MHGLGVMTATMKVGLIARVLDALDIKPLRKPNDHLWHKCRAPIPPQRTVEGGWTASSGEAWRRFTGSGWQYSQNPTSFEDWADDQW
jgi:hypothetical protein